MTSATDIKRVLNFVILSFTGKVYAVPYGSVKLKFFIIEWKVLQLFCQNICVEVCIFTSVWSLDTIIKNYGNHLQNDYARIGKIKWHGHKEWEETYLLISIINYVK